jgi:hypothetical protein
VFQGLRLRQDDDKDPWVEETFDAELLAEAKRQGKTIYRYVGKMMSSGANCLAPNVLVERLGLDRFGLLVEVQRLGEQWKTPINVGEKWLEEVNANE